MDQELQRDNQPAGNIFLEGVFRLDCAMFEPSAGVIGQSWRVDLNVSGALDDHNFVYDFSSLKKMARQVMKDSVDHALLMPIGSQFVHFSEDEAAEQWRLHAQCKLTDTNFVWDYKCPEGAVFPIRSVTIRPNLVEQELARLLKHRMPQSVSDVQVSLKEESSEPTAAFFRYTHGIANHAGLCQRLFHGHRSRVEIYVGDERRADLEHFVSREIFGSSVHIATPSQVVSGYNQVGKRGPVGEAVVLSYKGSTGKFEATIPADKIFLVERETSIECVAMQIATVLKAEEKQSCLSQPASLKALVKVRKPRLSNEPEETL